MLALIILIATIFGFVLPAFATPISTIFRDYGNSTGKVDPGGNDPLSSNYVEVFDNSQSRFSDVFNFSALDFDVITSFDLTLNFSDTGSTFLGWATEDWYVRPAESTSLATNTLFNLTHSQAKMEQIISFDINNLDIFQNIVDNKSFYLWFSEKTSSFTGADSFKLYSAKLDIYGTQTVINATNPTPEPATMLLFGVGLLGITGVNRKNS